MHRYHFISFMFISFVGIDCIADGDTKRFSLVKFICNIFIYLVFFQSWKYLDESGVIRVGEVWVTISPVIYEGGLICDFIWRYYERQMLSIAIF